MQDFSDRVTGNAKKFAKNAKILQFDVDAAEMNKNVLITEGVVGDIKVILEKINAKLEQQSHPEWMKKIMDYKEKYPLTYHPEALTGPFIVEEIYRQTNGEAIIVHRSWTASDVGSTVLQIYEAKNTADIRRTWNDGIWTWSCSWS